MTLAALADASGISAQSITAYENHRKSPSEETLSSLSAALNFPVSFFQSPPAPEMPLDAVSFRAPTKMSAAERDSTLSSGAIAAIMNDWLEKHFRLPRPNIPTYPHLEPEQAAEQTRRLWGLGDAPAPNMVHLLEANGVRVFTLAPDCQQADAFSVVSDGTPYVFLGTGKTGERGRFDAAHELGHLVLHCEHVSPRPQQSEPQANAFASAFLMPRAGLLAQQLHNADLERILRAKSRWGVSAMAMTHRMHNLGLLSDWRYRQTASQLAQLGYRKSEPGSDMPRESSQLLAKVFKALRSRHLTAGDISAHMGIPQEDLNDYVFGLVPTIVDEDRVKQIHPREDLTTTPHRPAFQLIQGEGTGSPSARTVGPHRATPF